MLFRVLFPGHTFRVELMRDVQRMDYILFVEVPSNPPVRLSHRYELFHVQNLDNFDVDKTMIAQITLLLG